MDPLTLYLVAGQIALVGFKGAHNVVRAPPPAQPGWALSDGGQLALQSFFSISGLSSMFITIYGFAHLDWWIPLATFTIGFPFTYYSIIRPIVGDIFSMTIRTFFSVGASVVVGFKWLS